MTRNDAERGGRGTQRPGEQHSEASNGAEKRPQGEQQGHSESPPPTPISEWLVGIMGLLVVLGVISFLVYQAIASPATPPQITFEKQAVTPLASGYLLQFKVMNRGEATAAGLTVEGTLRGPDGTLETSDVTFDFVPQHAEKEGGLFFRGDPRQSEVELTARGYHSP